MPLTPGQGPEQGMTPPPAERGPREAKQFPITVDGERTSYPENYPHQFIVDGPPASIRRIMGGIDGDRSKLGPAINAYLRPSKELFSGNLPDWYNQTLAPILQRNHLSLANLRPQDVDILGDEFRSVLERVYDFPFPKEMQIKAARNMGQTEGTVPTLSALMQELRKSDSIRFEQLMTSILEKGPDGLVMAAYLTAPKPEEHAEESEINFDKAFSVAADGRIQIDPKALEALRNVSFEDLRKAFEKKGGNYIEPDELKSALAAKRNALAANTFDSLIANQNQAEITEGQDTSRKSFTSYGPNGEPYRMIGNPPLPEKKPEETQLDLDKVVKRDETEQEYIDPQALRDFYGTTWERLRERLNQGTSDISYDASDKILHPERYRLNEPKNEPKAEE